MWPLSPLRAAPPSRCWLKLGNLDYRRLPIGWGRIADGSFTHDGGYMTERPISDVAQLAGRLAEMRAEVRDYAEKIENADIRDQLMETVGIFERVINRLAKPRSGKIDG